MKVLLDIKDEKAPFLMKLLDRFSFVKAKQITDEKAELMGNIRESVEEFKLVRQGKLKGVPAEELLDEL